MLTESKLYSVVTWCNKLQLLSIMALTAIETATILLDTLQRIIQVAIFSLLRAAYVNVQWIFWRFNGTARQVKESVLPENYERCVQVLEILFHHSFDWCLGIEMRQFVLAHNRFESPSYILDNDHVTLLTLTESHAVFAEARDRSARLWQTQYGAFLKLAQVRHSNRLLFVPLDAFHRLSESIGDPEARVVFLHSTGRCGSTLIVQMLNATDRFVSISEPDACDVLYHWARGGKRSEAAIDQLHKDVIRLVCRPYKTLPRPPLVYLVKFPSYHARHMSRYQKLFPRSRQLFMYRDMLAAIRSQYGMMMGMIGPRTQLAIEPLLPNWANMYLCRSVGVLDERFFYEGDTVDRRLFGLGMLVEAVFYYLECRRNGLDVAAIRYEDVVTDPAYACRRILEFCGAPATLTEKALQGMKTDSQRSSPIAKKAVGHYKCPEFNAEFRQIANRLLRKNGLPEVEEELLLEGTITQRNSEDFQI